MHPEMIVRALTTEYNLALEDHSRRAMLGEGVRPRRRPARRRRQADPR
jgi:hypothetical protein